MTYVVSDLHGCHPDKLKRLLSDASFSDTDDLFVLGDVIDRGDFGIDLLRFIMGCPNAYMLLGNHEAMMNACSFLVTEVTEESVYKLTRDAMTTYLNWLYNGAQPTVDGLAALTQPEREEIFAFLAELPLYETCTVGDRDFIFTHSGLGSFDKEKKLSDYSPHDLLWTRPSFEDRYYDDVTVVFGHTPTRFYGSSFDGHVIVTDTWINADAGCACGNAPVLLRLDDMREFSADGERTVFPI